MRAPALPHVTACRDRTAELAAVLRSLRERQLAPAPAGHAARPAGLLPHVQFMAIAKLIGRDVAQTYAKLEKLTLLAKRKSIYNDRPLEIEELTHIIRQDMASLNKQILQLQELGRARTPAAGQHVQHFSSNVVVTLQSKLAAMSNQFKGVLERRTESLRQQRRRRQQFSGSSVSASLPPSALSGCHRGSVLLADEEAAARAHAAIDMNGAAASLQIFAEEQDAFLYESRSEAMKNIESTVVELGTIFQQLAHMVQEHGEMVQRIDANVEDTSVNVEAAHSEILKYFQSVSSNRWLMVKVFGVLITFFLVFVIFLT
ncbi:syntaxin-5-like isoform X2 [Pollicipes pollicipes]|uniref:syntaxin-5-like n=1 Tax=Pollicipes pollicipes TaxID=41117 RepID=UPI0018852D09|nr:syntaxin-5-like [Pollicipes pollicipes]XP_037085837.1 syntaxin-5-like [Pollicipes pollicipes]XP_037086251.1 syntaxin-5-like isoform X2 [Pollicipes pollicipes]